MLRRGVLLLALFAGVVAASTAGDPPAGPAPEALWDPGPEATTLSHVARVPYGAGAGLWVEDGYAYVSALHHGFFIVDVSDPEAPLLVGELGGIEPRDVDLLHVDGRRIAVLAAQFKGTHFVDVTDPSQPVLLSTFNFDGGPVFDVPVSHNVAAVPGTPYVYQSRGGVAWAPLREVSRPVLGNAETGWRAPGIDIVDASDPENPVLAAQWQPPEPGYQCHDITLHVDVARAYCAGGNRTAILDISDPLNPRELGRIFNPLVSLHHTAMANPSHTLLVIGDEEGGGKSMNGCRESREVDGRTVSTPTGALWFYDIRDPAEPELRGWVSAPRPEPSPGASCTAHFGDFVSDTRLVMGWYSAGVLLIDAADAENPRIVDQWVGEAKVWEARHAGGYVFTGDRNHGLDVLRLA